ncbi:signal peptidase II [Hydrogenophaga sp. BPS33]|uniref:signal peptidase II n=1 Tax=Hydrogenophaga sp. BPS33 TaxID=2651974 RepID=UPI00131FF49A|nr:signal peptidase II [Hydrogenophaga sp. BPS33]QHE89170.1 signal peptidase II [Hydrogenophaga sp. BPS33]
MTARWAQRNPRWTWLAAIAALLFVDQISKSYFSTTLALGEAVRVTEWLNFVHVLNTGAAFSLLADAGGWQRWFFIGVSVLVVGVVSVVCLARQAAPLDRWVGAFVVGGGGGNLVDRVQIGAVVDFLDFHWRSIHWPAFNLADVFIVCSMLVWCFASLKAPPRRSPRKTPGELPS